MEPTEFAKLTTDEERLAAVNCGFELETQEFMGTTWNQLEFLCQEDQPVEVDLQAWGRALDAHMLKAQQDPVFLLACLDNPAINFKGTLSFAVYRHAGYLKCHRFEHPIEATAALGRDWAEEMFKAGHGVTLADIASRIYKMDLPIVMSAMRQWFIEHTEPQSNYEKPKPYASATQLLELPVGLQAVRDASVAGPELITDGPMSAAQFRELAAWCFGRKPQIDEHCSFHVSLSLPDRHGVDAIFEDLAHDERFQLAAQEGLLLWQDEWPRAVLTRARDSGWMQRYAAISGARDKYTLVANRLTRWEFRLWGNIRKTEDAMQCLLLSARAYQHAWRVRLGLEPLLIDNGQQLIEQWRKAV